MVTGKTATLTADVPAVHLATIPLAQAMGIPAVKGDLNIELVSGTVTSTFVGTCANAGHFAGTVHTGGTVTLGGTLVVEVPLVGEKTFDLGAMAMQIPAVDTPIVFATPDDPQASGCSAAGGGSGNGNGNGDGDGNGSGSGSGSGGGDGGGGGDEGVTVWNVYIDQVTIPASPNGGQNWDAAGYADPYVVFFAGSSISARRMPTRVLTDVRDTADFPELVGTVTTEELENDGYAIELMDKDGAGDRVRTEILDPDAPTDDIMASEGGVWTPSPDHRYTSYDGYIHYRIEPAY
jgi:hypothetical protein